MPIKVEDFSWSETEQMVFITVPLKVRHVPGTVHVLDFNRPRSTLFEACDETGSPAVVCNDNRTLRSNPLPSVPWTLLGTCRGSNQQKQTSIQTSYTLRCPPGMFALHSHSLKQLLRCFKLNMPQLSNFCLEAGRYGFFEYSCAFLSCSGPQRRGSKLRSS